LIGDEIGALVGADDAGLELALIGEGDRDLVGRVDDGARRWNVAVGLMMNPSPASGSRTRAAPVRPDPEDAARSGGKKS